MVDLADPVFFGAAWRFGDFCQQLGVGAVYLQSILKRRRPLSAHDRRLRLAAQTGSDRKTDPVEIFRFEMGSIFIASA
jgi:hypothetical protein